MKTSRRFWLLFVVLIAGVVVSLCQDIPDEARRHMTRGIAAVEASATDGDLMDAIAEFRKAAELAPRWADPSFNLGKIYEKLGNTDAAINAYGTYIQLAENAPDVEEVRQTIVKLQFKSEKESRLKKVYEMMTSPNYTRKQVSQTTRVFIWPMPEWGMVNGKMVAYNQYKKTWNDWFPPKKFSPEWVPVTVNNRFYEYRFTYYQCDLAGSRGEGAPAYCPFDVVVKGEVIALDPPRIKETETVSASWSSRPNPAGCPTGTGEWVWDIVPK